MFSSSAARNGSTCHRCAKREGDEVCAVAFREHRLNRSFLGIHVVLRAPFRVRERSAILFKHGHQAGLSDGSLRIASRNDIEEAFVFQRIQNGIVPLTANEE